MRWWTGRPAGSWNWLTTRAPLGGTNNSHVNKSTLTIGHSITIYSCDPCMKSILKTLLALIFKFTQEIFWGTLSECHTAQCFIWSQSNVVGGKGGQKRVVARYLLRYLERGSSAPELWWPTWASSNAEYLANLIETGKRVFQETKNQEHSVLQLCPMTGVGTLAENHSASHE